MHPKELSGEKVLRDDYLIFYGSINTPSAVQPSAVSRWLPGAPVSRWHALGAPDTRFPAGSGPGSL